VLSPPVGAQLYVLPNGFTPKAKVIFLAACGVDANFIAQWQLGPGQALIVPVYDPYLNPTMQISLNAAAFEWKAMLQVLGTSGTVNEAVAAGNVQAAADVSDYWWQVVPTGGGGVNLNAASQ